MKKVALSLALALGLAAGFVGLISAVKTHPDGKSVGEVIAVTLLQVDPD